MFKKTKIAAATVALLSAAAVQNVSAVAIDDSGSNAQVLVFPYYNTNNGFSTGFNIRNTKNEYKAVKVRFRESKLSNDVLDFNVYMSPHDRIALGVNVNAAGHASISTIDTTCTYPTLPAGGVEFKGDVYKNTNFDDAREGYLEVIEMGVVTNTTVQAGILHDSNGKPKDCSVIATAWGNGSFTEGGANAVVNGVNHEPVAPNGISRPTGGLQGWSFLLDFDKGNAFVAKPAAIRNYQTAHGQHYLSSNVNTFLLPSLASGNDASSVVMNNAGTASISTTWAKAVDYAGTTAGIAETSLASGGTAPTASGVNPYPVAHVLAATGISNDYLVTPSPENGGTDWVVTFPMRKHGIYPSVTYPDSTKPFQGTPTDGDVKIAGTSAFYSSEEQSVSIATDGFSPVSSSPAELLPREVNIISFGIKGSGTLTQVLRSKYTKGYAVDYTNGFGTINFQLANQSSSAITSGATFKGVPVIGFAALRGDYKSGTGNTIGETVEHSFNRDR